MLCENFYCTSGAPSEVDLSQSWIKSLGIPAARLHVGKIAAEVLRGFGTTPDSSQLAVLLPSTHAQLQHCVLYSMQARSAPCEYHAFYPYMVQPARVEAAPLELLNLGSAAVL